MRRVLIVDDEPIIVEGLLSVLSGSGLDIELYSAGGGEEALRILSRVRMDAVISDIRMPGMDGLQLLERIHADWPECRVIFLSGYNEFDTVYKAIQSPAVTFLLKTEGFDKIIATLRETLLGIEREKRDQETVLQLSAQQALTRHMLQREALSSLVLGEDGDTEALFKAAGLALRAEKNVLTLYAYVEGGSNGLSLERFHEKLILIDQALRARLQHYPIEIAFWNKREDLLWLLQPNEGQSAERCALYVREHLELVQEAAQRETGLSLAFALDSSPIPLGELPRAYAALRLRVCQGVGVPGMIALRAPEGKRAGEAPLLPPAALERLRELLEHQNRAEFLPMLRRATDELRKAQAPDDPFALEAYLALTNMYISYINRFRLNERVAIPGGLRAMSSPMSYGGWAQAADAMDALGEELLAKSDSDQGGRAQAVMAQIKEHIENHLGDSDALSLARIAEKTYFNPAYLSRLFRQTTGETLSEYVGAARMRRANTLLHDPKVKIGDVGEAVGFSSSANFARFYRKMMGCTPQEYRDRLSRQELQKR